MRLPAGDPKWPMTRVFTRFAVYQTLDMWPLMTFKSDIFKIHQGVRSSDSELGRPMIIFRINPYHFSVFLVAAFLESIMLELEHV